MKDKNAVLSDVIKGYRGVSYKPWQLKSTVDNDTAILLRSNNIKDGRLNFNDVQYVPKSIVDENQTLKKGDLVVCMSNGSKDLVGKNATFNLDSNFTFTIGAFCSVFKPKAGATIEYVRHLFSDNNYQKHIDLILAGSAINNLRNTQIEELKCYIPDYPIQQKIAKILSTIDGQIEKTEGIIAKYQAVKQGMLQDLFTRGIDVTTGELRPKYEDAPELYKNSPLGMIPKEWKVVRLYDTVTVLDSMRIPIKQEDRDFMQKVYPYYGASGIIDHVNDYLFDDELILLGEDGENVISRNLPLAFIVKGKIWVNNHAHVFKPNGELIIELLVEQLEKFNYSTYVSGSAQPKITQDHLKKISVFVPHKIEQNRIIDSISSTNKTIEDEQMVLDKLYKLKQGLMSDLLSGKVEVKI